MTGNGTDTAISTCEKIRRLSIHAAHIRPSNTPLKYPVKYSHVPFFSLTQFHSPLTLVPLHPTSWLVCFGGVRGRSSFFLVVSGLTEKLDILSNCLRFIARDDLLLFLFFILCRCRCHISCSRCHTVDWMQRSRSADLAILQYYRPAKHHVHCNVGYSTATTLQRRTQGTFTEGYSATSLSSPLSPLLDGSVPSRTPHHTKATPILFSVLFSSPLLVSSPRLLSSIPFFFNLSRPSLHKSKHPYLLHPTPQFLSLCFLLPNHFPPSPHSLQPR